VTVAEQWLAAGSLARLVEKNHRARAQAALLYWTMRAATELEEPVKADAMQVVRLARKMLIARGVQ
jgi:hypothetical protein